MSTISTPLHTLGARKVNSKAMSESKPTPEEAQKLREFEEQAIPLMPLMYGIARKITKDGYSWYVEDLVQETYVKAFRGWHTFEQGTKLSAWMIRIMKNTLLNLQIKEGRSQHVASYDDMEEWQKDRNPESVTARTNLAAEAEAIANMPAAVIEKALADLDPKRRRIIELVLIEGYSYAEAARELKTAEGTIMSSLHRGKSQLRAKLAEYAAEQGYDVTPKTKAKKKKI